MVFLCPSTVQEHTDKHLQNPHECWYVPAKLLYQKIRERHDSPTPLEGPDFVQEHIKRVQYSKVGEFSSTSKLECLFSRQLISVLITCPVSRQILMRPIPVSPQDYQLGLPDLDMTALFDVQLTEHIVSLEFAGYDYFEKEKLLGVGVTSTKATPTSVGQGKCRTIHLFAMGWNATDSCYYKIAYGEFELDELSLLLIPNSVVRPQVNTSRVSVEFIKEKNRIFGIFRPCATRIPCIIVYCMYRGRFVPISGNSNLCAGLFVFKENSFTIYAEKEKSQERILYLGTFNGYINKKSAFTVCRINFRGL